MHTTALPTQLVGRGERELVELVARSNVYRRYERSFGQATGLPLVLQPVEFFGLPFQGRRNENPFCAFLATNKQWCALYLRTHGRHLNSPGEDPRSFQCPFGLTETTIPIRMSGRLIAFLCTGQVFTQPPDVIVFQETFRALFDSTSNLEKKAFELWEKTPFIPPEKYDATVQLLTFFARQIATVANRIAIRSENAEPPVIAKARRFIAENRTETLSLEKVAKAAGASVFHFCKLFHRETGLKFTDYVARLRIEDARRRLVNRKLRVSEVAYDAGFQSLTQFNRTFHRVFGQSPTEYRAHLPAVAGG